MWVKLKITDPASRAGIREEIRAKRGWDVQSNAFIEPYAHLLCGDAAGAAALLLASDVDIDEGLHLLLAMCHHKLLDDGGRRLVYPHLYAFVTEVFAANQEAALRYFSLIPDEPLVIEYIAKLAVEVENGWEMFQPDSRIAHVQLPPIGNVLDLDIREPILDRAAKIAEDRGEYRKAARLHAFAGRFASVVELDCTQLIQRINGFGDVDVAELVRQYEGVRAAAVDVPADLLETMRILLGLASVAVLSDSKKYSDAVEQLERIEFFPASRKQLQQYRERLSHSHPLLTHVVPKALLLALEAYAEVFKTLLPADDKAKQILKEKSELLIRLSGVLKLPRAVQKRALDLDNQLQL